MHAQCTLSAHSVHATVHAWKLLYLNKIEHPRGMAMETLHIIKVIKNSYPRPTARRVSILFKYSNFQACTVACTERALSVH